jgi:putative FmdB family regulatory protein
MPTYEYGCTACGSEWEQVQRITEPPTEVCPKCGKTAAHRLISAGTNFILKGGGWYSDLYSSSKSTGNKAESNGTTSTDTAEKGVTKAEPAKGDATKSETKSEAKTETKATPPSSPPAAGSSS